MKLMDIGSIVLAGMTVMGIAYPAHSQGIVVYCPDDHMWSIACHSGNAIRPGEQGWMPPTGNKITEDSPQWDCADMGDRVCGPDNASHVPAGCYDEGGVLVAPWPCRVVVNPDGTADVYK